MIAQSPQSPGHQEILHRQQRVQSYHESPNLKGMVIFFCKVSSLHCSTHIWSCQVTKRLRHITVFQSIIIMLSMSMPLQPLTILLDPPLVLCVGEGKLISPFKIGPVYCACQGLLSQTMKPKWMDQHILD